MNTLDIYSKQTKTKVTGSSVARRATLALTFFQADQFFLSDWASKQGRVKILRAPGLNYLLWPPYQTELSKSKSGGVTGDPAAFRCKGSREILTGHARSRRPEAGHGSRGALKLPWKILN